MSDFDAASVLDSLDKPPSGSPRRYSYDEAIARRKISMQASSEAKTVLAQIHADEYQALREEIRRRKLQEKGYSL